VKDGKLEWSEVTLLKNRIVLEISGNELSSRRVLQDRSPNELRSFLFDESETPIFVFRRGSQFRRRFYSGEAIFEVLL